MYTLVLEACKHNSERGETDLILLHPEVYKKRAACFIQIEMFVNATEDLQAACDLRPYADASLSSATLYKTMERLLQDHGIDFD